MSDDDTDEIDTLTQRIHNLHIQLRATERKLKEVQGRQVARQARGRRRKGAPQTPTNSEGNRLYIGDKIRFLTTGRYRSTQGTIVTFGSRFFISKDNTGNIINREYKNT